MSAADTKALDAFLDGALIGFMVAVLVGLPVLVLTFWLTGWGIA